MIVVSREGDARHADCMYLRDVINIKTSRLQLKGFDTVGEPDVNINLISIKLGSSINSEFNFIWD